MVPSLQRPLTKEADQSEIIENPIPHLPNPEVLEGILSTEITKWESPQFHRRSSRIFSSFRRSKIPKKESTSHEGILSVEGKACPCDCTLNTRGHCSKYAWAV